MQASEGDILEVSGRKRRQNACRLSYNGLLGDEAALVNQKLRKLDFNEKNSAPEKDLQKTQKDAAPIIEEISDTELGDENFFYGRQGSKAVGLVNTVVKLNKQEEEDLIKDLEMQAQANDTLKELDEALMDRTTAQQSLRNKSQFLSQHTKINSSNFQKSN